MNVEIEAKLKVDSLDEVAVKLGGVGAVFVEEQLQTDYFFDDTNKSLTQADKCLRLRQQGLGRRSKFLLTFKGPREKMRFKRREEIEIKITDAISARKLFEALGYQEILAFEKKRRLWRLGGCSIALDELPLLGSFVEIEGPDEDSITEAQKKLGLENIIHIPESYAALIAEKLRDRAKEQKNAGK